MGCSAARSGHAHSTLTHTHPTFLAQQSLAESWWGRSSVMGQHLSELLEGLQCLVPDQPVGGGQQEAAEGRD